MKINQSLLIALYKKLKGDRLYDLSSLGYDATNDKGKCVGYEDSNYKEMRLIFQRQRGGWPFTVDHKIRGFITPGINPIGDAYRYWCIALNESVVRELLRQKKLKP